MVRVALFGEFGVGNVGNDWSASTAVELLRRHRPDATTTLIARDPESAVGLGLPALPLTARAGLRFPVAGRLVAKLADLVHLTRTVAAFDLVLVPGTGMLEAARQRSPGGVIVWLLLLGLACRLRRVPLLWFALGGSTYAHAAPARTAALAALLARRRSYRDPVTRAALRRAGAPVGDDPVIPDIVFALDPGRISPPRRRRVLVGAIDWRGAGADTTYTTELATLVQRLRDAGDEVGFVVADDADVGPTEAVLAALAGPRPSVVDRQDFVTLRSAVAAADVVVASRYHVLVAALLERRPVLALSHAGKDDELMAWVGTPEAAVPVAAFTADAVADRVAALLADPSGWLRQVGPALDRAASEVDAEFAATLQAVLPNRFSQAVPA